MTAISNTPDPVSRLRATIEWLDSHPFRTAVEMTDASSALAPLRRLLHEIEAR